MIQHSTVEQLVPVRHQYVRERERMFLIINVNCIHLFEQLRGRSESSKRERKMTPYITTPPTTLSTILLNNYFLSCVFLHKKNKLLKQDNTIFVKNFLTHIRRIWYKCLQYRVQILADKEINHIVWCHVMSSSISISWNFPVVRMLTVYKSVAVSDSVTMTQGDSG